MSSMHHISRLQYKVSCPDEGQAFELRHMLSSTGTAQLMDVMQAVCDRHVSEGHFIRIPKLEIRLDAVTLNGLTEELALRFGAALEDELRKQHVAAGDKQYEPTQEIDALLYYLRYGFLPRWALLLIKQVYDVAAVAIEKSPERLKRFLYYRVQDYKVWERIRSQFSLEVGNALIAIMPELMLARQNLSAVWATWYMGDNIERVPWGGDEVEAAISETILQEAQRILLKEQTTEGLFAALMIRINHVPGNLPGGGSDDMIKRPQILSDDSEAKSVPLTSEEAITVLSLHEIPAIPQEDTEEPSAEIDEKLLSHTAGLVLLHPFLKPFYTELGLFAEGDWKDEPSRQRAIHLLHFLATGEQEQGEWNLILEKLMCGLTPDYPIERRITLSDAELGECDALLAAVIQHWAALKKTSPRGLQETFLKRDGLLFKTDKGWQLQTERKTEDVLLEAIPWSYGIIKLPWNEYLIEVLW